MKHTLGKWEVNLDSANKVVVVSPWTDKNKPGNSATFGDYRGAYICEMDYNSGVPTKEQAEANARLIASAPELLEACDQALIEFNFLHDYLTLAGEKTRKQLEQAIAKTESK